MNKAELITAMAESASVTKKVAEQVLKSFQEIVATELSKDGKVQMVGFGTFETSKRSARTGRNPQTKAAIEIPASTVPRFKPGKALKESVNQ
ncbi:MAG: DNA-binding protein [Clostridiales bacterium GWE2_32_10]|nr:MAG: DNA-binding protein [Clostridiales bacterium GWE2_32_10]HBY20267.1 HU family DNA-binding protein [Clostridiales bacterium]